MLKRDGSEEERTDDRRRRNRGEQRQRNTEREREREIAKREIEGAPDEAKTRI